MGGAEQVIKNITLETSKLGTIQKVLALNTIPSTQNHAGAEVQYFKESFSYASCPFSISLWHNLKKISQYFDLIHYHYPWPFADLIHLSSNISKPFIITYHADIIKTSWQRNIYKPLQRAFLKRADKIILTSPKIIDSSKDLQNFRNKCTTIPLGIDPLDYPNAPSETLKKWQQQLGENFILFIGVLRQYKGLPYLLQAAEQTQAQIIIAGDGPQKQELEQIIKNKNLKNVKLLGHISNEDKSALLQLCEAVVLPSQTRAEAFGICLLEALTFKKPLITTELGTGTSFVNQHEITGLVIPAKDSKRLAQAINQLTLDKELCQKYGENGFQWFMNEFTSATMGARYLNIYKEILDKK